MTTPQVGQPAPVTEGVQGEQPVPVTEPQTPTAPQEPAPAQATPPMSQEDWQAYREEQTKIKARLDAQEQKDFEKDWPIVLNEKYKEAWVGALAHRKPGDKYEKLSLEEIKSIVCPTQETMNTPTTPAPPTPSLGGGAQAPQSKPSGPVPQAQPTNPSMSPKLPKEVPQDSRSLLLQRYSDDEIDNAGVPAA